MMMFQLIIVMSGNGDAICAHAGSIASGRVATGGAKSFTVLSRFG